MIHLPERDSALAQVAADFAGKITPSRERWAYCLDRASFSEWLEWRGETFFLNERVLPVCDRILGIYRGASGYRLKQLRERGYDGAEEHYAKRWSDHGKPFFGVGPMEGWHVGHVYFARLVDHPHVVKVGFSRRVRERLEDVESKCKAKLFVNPGDLRVGTLADEHWWHREWRKSRISGEWFFDPATTDRSLPAFLAPKSALEAA